MAGRRRFVPVVRVLGAVLLLLGGVALGAQIFYPEQTEKYTGRAKVSLEHRFAELRGQEHVTVTLGATGGKALLDACDGTFPRLTVYEKGGALPTYAAHNFCKGDVILPVELGDTIEVKGQGLYEVTDQRIVPKLWSTTDDLLGLEGEFLLQTCYYGENRMKFLALTPLDPRVPGEPTP